MKCPNCDETLVMTERQGVEIDYCPKCRGVWLDKGELDKIIEKSTASSSSESFRQQEKKQQNRRDDDDDDDDDNNFGRGNRKRDGGFLSNLFDF
jgi:Zn-finger nucleic acid-binding protein